MRKSLLLFLLCFYFNSSYATCFSIDEKNICRYLQGDDWCKKNRGENIFSYRGKCDFFNAKGPEYSNDASGSGAYIVFISRFSPYTSTTLDNGNLLVSAKLKESYDLKTGVVSAECQGKEFINIHRNDNGLIDESFLKSYVERNKKRVGSFMCDNYFSIKKKLKTNITSTGVAYGECLNKDVAEYVNSYVSSNKYAHDNELEVIPNYFKCINPLKRLEKYVCKDKQLLNMFQLLARTRINFWERNERHEVNHKSFNDDDLKLWVEKYNTANLSNVCFDLKEQTTNYLGGGLLI